MQPKFYEERTGEPINAQTIYSVADYSQQDIYDFMGYEQSICGEIYDEEISGRYPNLYIGIQTEKAELIREIQLKTGIVWNGGFTVYPEYQSKGIGAKVLYKQVGALRAAGFKRIETYAEGRYKHEKNGYYTWARLGYTMSDYDDCEVFESMMLERDLPYKRLSDLVDEDYGDKNVWKYYGFGFSGSFDLSTVSTNKEVMVRYMLRKGLIKDPPVHNL